MAEKGPDSRGQVGGFPGYGFLDGYFNLYVDGLKNVVRACNRTWDAAANPTEEYTFGKWLRDWTGIWSRVYGLGERLWRYPSAYEEEGRPVWVPIVADARATAVKSRRVDLLGRVEEGREPVATDLERLGGADDSIPAGAIEVALDDQRDSITVGVKLPKDKYAKGTYVGFVKDPKSTGAPLAIIFLSYGT
jgi:hypothetical protein